MGNPKITGFIIALVLVGLFTAIYGLTIAEFNNNYDIDNSNINLTAYNQLNSLSEKAEEVQEKTNIEEKSGVLDIIGSYIGGAYDALYITAESFNIFNKMSEQAFIDADLGAGGTYLKTALYTIVIVLIFVGVFLAALMKWKL